MSFGLSVATSVFSLASVIGVAAVLNVLRGQNKLMASMVTRVDDEWFELAKSHNLMWKEAMDRLKMLLDREVAMNDRLNKELLREREHETYWCSLGENEVQGKNS
mmetsp:Transcript_20289/g.51921  ORF Transcript_20289/g.51921 Transcript_20289/m.51921 type:complete len:105 (-) Transcript_20289:7158-7472(-)